MLTPSSSHRWRPCRLHRTSHHYNCRMCRFLHRRCPPDCRSILRSSRRRSSHRRVWCRICIRHHHFVYVRVSASEGPWGHCGRIPVLHHTGIAPGFLRRLRHSDLHRLWLIPNPNCASNALGSHSCWRSLVLARITSLLCPAWQPGKSHRCARPSSRATSGIRVYPAGARRNCRQP